MNVAKAVQHTAQKAKAACADLAKASSAKKNEALRAIAADLRRQAPAILKANAADLTAAKAAKLSQAMLDRLLLDEKRLEGIARGVEDVAGLEDPVGKVVEERERPNGLRLQKVRVPYPFVPTAPWARCCSKDCGLRTCPRRRFLY